MSEIEIRGTKYRTGKLSAFDQLHVARRIAPLVKGWGEGYISALSRINGNGAGATDGVTMIDAVSPILDEFSKMADDDTEYVVKKCMMVVQRFNGNSWVPFAAPNGMPMFETDADMLVMLWLSVEVIRENLGPFMTEILGQGSAEVPNSPLN